MFKPVELSSAVKGFYSHVSFEYLIRKGWDFEEDPKVFFDRKSAEDAMFGANTYATITRPDSSIVDVTERDVFLAGQGTDTPALRELMESNKRAIDAHFEQKGTEIDPNVRVGVSMHSGSSDYLFVSDVLVYVEKVLALG